MKSKLFGLLVITLTLCFVTGSAFADTIIVDGKTIDAEPINVDGRLLVPIGCIASSFDVSVNYYPESNKVSIFKSPDDIELFIGDYTATVNQEKVYMGVPAQIFNDRTYVPLSFISKAFGCEVRWDDSTRTAIITIPEAIPTMQTITLNDGSTFTGMVLNKQPAGQGTRTYPNDIKLEGVFDGDNSIGSAKAYFPNGIKYEGDFKDGDLTGKGTFWFTDGSKYVGDVVHRLFEGYGEVYWPDGTKYCGHFKAGEYDGTGIAYFPDGTSEQQYWVNGQQRSANNVKPISNPSTSINNSTTYTTPSATADPNLKQQRIDAIRQLAQQKRNVAQTAYTSAYNTLTNEYNSQKTALMNEMASRGALESSYCQNGLQALYNTYVNGCNSLKETLSRQLAEIDAWETQQIASLG